jgi:O-antigen ligase
LFGLSGELGPASLSVPGLALLAAWVALVLRSVWARARRAPVPIGWPASAYAAPVALFLAAALLSLLVSEYLLLSVRELRSTILEPLLFFGLLAVSRDREAPAGALYGFVAGAGLLAAAVLPQLVFGLGGTQAEGVLRAQAWYPSPNHVALTLGRAFPFLLARVLTRSPDEASLVPRRLAIGALALVGFGLVATFSVGAWLALAAVTVVLLALSGRRREATIAGGLLLAGFLLLGGLSAVGLVPERFSLVRGTGFLRIELWQSAVAMLADHPILGVGLDNFVYLYQQVYLREGGAAEPNLSHPHNWLLHVWLQLGTLGLIGFLWLLAVFARRARLLLRGSVETSVERWMVLGAVGCVLDMLLHGLVDNSYFLPDLALIFWLTLALVDLNPRPPGAIRRSRREHG